MRRRVIRRKNDGDGFEGFDEKNGKMKKRGRGGKSTKGGGFASNNLENVEGGLENITELKKRWMR
jgi:hypothetical protein